MRASDYEYGDKVNIIADFLVSEETGTTAVYKDLGFPTKWESYEQLDYGFEDLVAPYVYKIGMDN